MIRHHLLIIIRNIKKYQVSFLINQIGLTAGLTCVLLIYFWVKDEVLMDKFHQHDSQLYQVMENLETPQKIITINATAVPLAQALTQEMPEVEYAVSLNDFSAWRNREGLVLAGDKHLAVKCLHASKDYFNVFSHKLLAGDKDQVLADKSNIVISESLAKRMFQSTENAIGKRLDFKHSAFEGSYQVSGVFERHEHSSMPMFDIILTMEVMLDKHQWAKDWNGNYSETFVVLKSGTDVAAFTKKISHFLNTKSDFLGKFTLFLQKYSSIYLYGSYENGIPVGSRVLYVKLFTLIAVFILLIACINFMNLSTAQALRKMKEIGVKKTFGIRREALIGQYLTESVAMSLLSLIFAFVFVLLLLPYFNQLTGKQLKFDFEWEVLTSIIGIALLTGLISGVYPALYLSKFSPITVLKGKLNTSTGELWVRKGLVVLQYSLSIVFIIVFLVVKEQINFSQTKNLGYNRNNVISFKWKGDQDGQIESFTEAVRNLPRVENVSNMSGNILNEVYGMSNVSWRGQDTDREYIFQSPVVGYNFIETLGIEVIKGRSFSKEHVNDGVNLVVNEAAYKMMGLDKSGSTTVLLGDEERPIVGVVGNFNYGSLHKGVEPLIFRLDPTGKNILVKIKEGMTEAGIREVQALYQRFLPMYPFEYTFLDDDYRALYESETRVAELSKFFTLLAIIISCLGLFGLASFALQKRYKEICVRKVHGSSTLGIIVLLTADFMKPIWFSILIGLPVGYFIAKTWLDGFAYRIDLAWWFFAVAGALALFVAWTTIIGQTVKAASANPVKGLRDS